MKKTFLFYLFLVNFLSILEILQKNHEAAAIYMLCNAILIACTIIKGGE